MSELTEEQHAILEAAELRQQLVDVQRQLAGAHFAKRMASIRCAEKDQRIAGLEGRLAELGEQLEFDRSLVADCLTKARKAVASRDWLTEGRGCYEWNDHRWHEEFRHAADEFLIALEPMSKVAHDWSGCPKSGEEIAKARRNLKDQLAASQERERIYEASIQYCEAAFKRNKSRMWVLRILRERLAEARSVQAAEANHA